MSTMTKDESDGWAAAFAVYEREFGSASPSGVSFSLTLEPLAVRHLMMLAARWALEAREAERAQPEEKP